MTPRLPDDGLPARRTACTSHVESKTLTPSHQRPARRYERGPGSATRRDSRDRTQLMRSAAGGTAGEEEIMTAIRAVHVAHRQRASSQNGLPEPVPYVYGQQTRRNTYAARIAQRNVQGWWQPPAALPGPKVTRPQAPTGTAAQVTSSARPAAGPRFSRLLTGSFTELTWNGVGLSEARKRLLRTARFDGDDDGNVDHPERP